MLHLFNSKVDVVRPVRAPDGLGGWQESEVVSYKNLPCRINWTSGKEKAILSKTTYFRDAKLYCRPIEVENKDRVKFNDKTYKIVSIENCDNMNRYMILDIGLVE